MTEQAFIAAYGAGTYRTTRAILKQRIARVLKDTTGTEFDPDLIVDGIYAALDAVLDWYPKSGIDTSIVGDGEEVSFPLPADLYRIVAVFDGYNGLYLPTSTMSALAAPGDNIEANQDWIEWPEGYITFANPVTTDETMTVYYGAIWTKPAADADVIETPTWMDKALTFYACSYCLLSQATASAKIRQWNVAQVDSGTPVMNPMRDMSTYFLERFEIEMKRAPARLRGVRG